MVRIWFISFCIHLDIFADTSNRNSHSKSLMYGWLYYQRTLIHIYVPSHLSYATSVLFSYSFFSTFCCLFLCLDRWLNCYVFCCFEFHMSVYRSKCLKERFRLRKLFYPVCHICSSCVDFRAISAWHIADSWIFMKTVCCTPGVF